MVSNRTKRLIAVAPGERTVLVVVRQPDEPTDALAERTAARLRQVFRARGETHVWIAAAEGSTAEAEWLQRLVAGIVVQAERKGPSDGAPERRDAAVRSPSGSAGATRLELRPGLAKTTK